MKTALSCFISRTVGENCSLVNKYSDVCFIEIFPHQHVSEAPLLVELFLQIVLFDISVLVNLATLTCECNE